MKKTTSRFSFGFSISHDKVDDTNPKIQTQKNTKLNTSQNNIKQKTNILYALNNLVIGVLVFIPIAFFLAFTHSYLVPIIDSLILFSSATCLFLLYGLLFNISTLNN